MAFDCSKSTMLSTRLARHDLAHNYRVSMTAFDLFRPGRSGRLPVLFVCDHASNRLPESYGTLALTPELLATHIAYDIGAGTVTRTLAEEFGAPAILARWSRLLIDLNRGADDPTLVMKLSDGALIAGNARAGASEITRRTAAYHEPYHAAIAEEINAFGARGLVPSVISIHSFTPAWKGRRRPWEVGVLWDRDPRLAQPLLDALRAAGLVVGDNEPYSGELENDCLYRHGTMNGLPHVLIEIRQDLIATEAEARAFARRLKPILEAALETVSTPRIYFTRPLTMKGHNMDQTTRTELEAAVFRRLVAHLRERTDVQNIDLMITGGFCRNCLGDWYRDAAAEKGISLDKDEARGLIYGMTPAEWKTRYQKEATKEQQAAFEASQKIHK